MSMQNAQSLICDARPVTKERSTGLRVERWLSIAPYSATVSSRREPAGNSAPDQAGHKNLPMPARLVPKEWLQLPRVS